MNDSELREELVTIRNLLTEVLVNQDILAKRINADTAIKAVQTERAVELARLRRTADKATRRIATVDWAIVISTHWPSWTVWENRLERYGSLSSLHGENKRCFSHRSEGSFLAAWAAFPHHKHGVEHDHSTYRTSLILSSRTKIKDTDYHSPHRTSLEEDLVAHSSFLYQSKICERSKTSEKKLDVRRLISGDWFVSPKNVNPPSASYTNAVVAESWRTRSMSETVLIWSR